MTGFDFKAWYAENKDAVNKSRRDKYAEDVEYRERVKRRNQEARSRAHEEQVKDRVQKVTSISVRAKAPWKVITTALDVNGEETEGRYLTIGALASVLSRSVQTIRLWEKNGKIPKTPYRSRRGDRLYSEWMIEVVLKRVGESAKSTPRSKGRFQTGKVELGTGEVQSVRLYRVGVLSEVMDRTVAALTRMERKGYLPETPLRDHRNHRLYSYAMIVAVRTARDKFTGEVMGETDYAVFRSEIESAWEKQGIMGARLLGKP